MANASPQLEDGYTRISNEIMEALAKIRISGVARQVLDAIFRKVYGWGKTEDVISLSQFMFLTGLKKVAICKAIKKLLIMNIVTKKGNESGVSYGIQKDYTSWNSLPKKVTLSKKVIIVTKKGNNRYQKSHPQKKVLKESIKRNYSPNSVEIRMSELLVSLILLRHEGFKSPNIQQWALSIDRMIRLDKRKVSDIEAVIRWSQQDSFWKDNILSTKTLKIKYDKLFLKMKSSGKHTTNGKSLGDRLKAGDKEREQLGMNI